MANILLWFYVCTRNHLSFSNTSALTIISHETKPTFKNARFKTVPEQPKVSYNAYQDHVLKFLYNGWHYIHSNIIQ